MCAAAAYRRPAKNYTELRDIWYAKLKQSGFNDIETVDDRLVNYVRLYFCVRHHPDTIKFRILYYEAAGYFLHHHTFKNKRDQRIWALHAEGRSIREIALILSKEDLCMSKSTVFNVLKVLVAEMKAGIHDEE